MERGGAAIGRIASEQLAQPRIVEIFSELRHMVAKGEIRISRGKPADAGRGHKAERGGRCARMKVRSSVWKICFARSQNSRKRRASAAPAQLADIRRRLPNVGAEIELLGRRPGMTGQECRAVGA